MQVNQHSFLYREIVTDLYPNIAKHHQPREQEVNHKPKDSNLPNRAISSQHNTIH